MILLKIPPFILRGPQDERKSGPNISVHAELVEAFLASSRTFLATHRLFKNSVCKLLKKIQRRGARRSMSGGVLLYVDAKSVERNEAYEAFSAACLVHFVTQLPGHFPGDPRVGHLFEGNFFAGELT